MNSIEWKPKAFRQLLKLDKPTQIMIRDEVRGKLEAFPACTGVKALINHAYSYRLRVGSYRVLFDFFGGAACIVSIEEVRKRDERTY
ncbi:MAG: type II toxin-antitoxin system RelE/ParE family toxin [Burkholderiaceae bacterium]|nr:type II toxin-antitoxin system RelE/ParE family toxin [Burkholderiaceae bacterium]